MDRQLAPEELQGSRSQVRPWALQSIRNQIGATVNTIDTRAILRMDIGFYIGIILRLLIEGLGALGETTAASNQRALKSLYRIHVLLANL